MKTKYIYLLSALTLGFVSCQQGGQNADIMPGGAMSFKIIAPNANTRVANGAFEADDQIGLYVTDYIKDQTSAPLQISGNRANNVAMTYDGVKWMTERAVYWGESKADVYAYYPYMADIADVDEQPFAVATDQSVGGAYELSDLLWAKAAGVAQSDGAVQLEMKHAMSRLAVKIVAGEDYVGSLPKDATVHLHSTVTDALVSLVNGSVVKNPYGGANSIKMRNLGIHSFAEGDAVVYEAIVVPQMLETSVPLLEINSKSVSYLLEDMFNFKPGVSYTYTAVLNTSTTAIKIDIGCTTDDWNNMGGGSGDSGDGEGGAGSGGVDISGYADLSAEGTANCYLIKTAGNYKFKAVMGNSNATVGNVKKAEVLWETFGTDVMPNEGDLIASVFYQDGYVCFSTPETFADGNASRYLHLVCRGYVVRAEVCGISRHLNRSLALAAYTGIRGNRSYGVTVAPQMIVGVGISRLLLGSAMVNALLGCAKLDLNAVVLTASLLRHAPIEGMLLYVFGFRLRLSASTAGAAVGYGILTFRGIGKLGSGLLPLTYAVT